jgi:predicted transcriptional regulator
VARQDSRDPVAEFCLALRRVVQDCGLDRAVLARRLGYSRSQLYEILSGRIRRPPEWDRVVEPLIRACTFHRRDRIDKRTAARSGHAAISPLNRQL